MRYVSEESQRELAAGVLKQATEDLRRFHRQQAKSNASFTTMLIAGSCPMIFPGPFRSLMSADC